MKTIHLWKNDSAYITPLSPACKQCAKGSKMVLLVTGKCRSSCYYCPISEKKQGKDVIYADEWQLTSEKDTNKIITEAQLIEATGAGITGGDPLQVWKRVCVYIQLLKKEFGKDFHIHLYTSGRTNTSHLIDIIKAGVDEIRFHPVPNTWKQMSSSPLAPVIAAVLKKPVDVAIEIPAIPKNEANILSLISWAAKNGVKWLNLNELEFSETNAEKLLQKGYHVKNELSAAVLGSETTAMNVLHSISLLDLSIGVHYCSVSFKDGVQLRNRIIRRAHNVQKPFDVVTEEGTLIRGLITHSTFDSQKIKQQIQKKYQISKDLIAVDDEKDRVLIAPWILQKIASDLKAKGFACFQIEEYPTADHLEVERIPLPIKL